MRRGVSSVVVVVAAAVAAAATAFSLSPLAKERTLGIRFARGETNRWWKEPLCVRFDFPPLADAIANG